MQGCSGINFTDTQWQEDFETGFGDVRTYGIGAELTHVHLPMHLPMITTGQCAQGPSGPLPVSTSWCGLSLKSSWSVLTREDFPWSHTSVDF